MGLMMLLEMILGWSHLENLLSLRWTCTLVALLGNG